MTMELLFELWLYWFISVYGYYPTPQEFPPALRLPDEGPRPLLIPAGDPFAPPPPATLPPIVVPPPQA